MNHFTLSLSGLSFKTDDFYYHIDYISLITLFVIFYISMHLYNLIKKNRELIKRNENKNVLIKSLRINIDDKNLLIKNLYKLRIINVF